LIDLGDNLSCPTEKGQLKKPIETRKIKAIKNTFHFHIEPDIGWVGHNTCHSSRQKGKEKAGKIGKQQEYVFSFFFRTKQKRKESTLQNPLPEPS